MTDFLYEQQLFEKYPLIGGMDEAGRGPLAGPVVTACVVLDAKSNPLEGVTDSKKISEKKRIALYDDIVESCLDYSIAFSTHEEIDKYNILIATQLAMHRAVANLKQTPNHVLIDGVFYKPFRFQAECVVKGDLKHYSIAAASILAKVYRDRVMQTLCKAHPEYGFSQHKGYGTKAHREALLEHGPCEIHRQSFIGKILGRE